MSCINCCGWNCPYKWVHCVECGSRCGHYWWCSCVRPIYYYIPVIPVPIKPKPILKRRSSQDW